MGRMKGRRMCRWTLITQPSMCIYPVIAHTPHCIDIHDIVHEFEIFEIFIATVENRLMAPYNLRNAFLYIASH